LSLLLACALAGCPDSSAPDFDGDGADDVDDCDPADPNIHPNATDPYGNGVDENCDGIDGTDEDGDGYPADDGIDCNDLSASVNPGANENCGNGGDEDCDGLIDAADPDCPSGDDDDAVDDDDDDDSGEPWEPMVEIPGGWFWMGCNTAIDADCGGPEHPYHEVYIDTFWIDTTEATVGDFALCVAAGACSAPDTADMCNWNVEGCGSLGATGCSSHVGVAA